MKTHQSYFNFFLILLICFLGSCQNTEKQSLDKLSSDYKEENLIEKEIIEIDIEDATKMAAIFTKNITRSGDKDIKEITPIKDNEGNTMIYCVNFTNNNGYILISSSKRFTSILANSSEGNLDINNLDPTTSILINSYIKNIKNNSNDKKDSLRVKYSLDWIPFEKTNSSNNPTTRLISNNYDKEIEKDKWRNKGWECYPVEHAINIFGYDRGRAIILDAEMHTNPEYKHSSFLVARKTNSSTGTPLIKSDWGQGAPFNINASNGYAGCYPIAMAQIMRYHKHPEKYNWDMIPIYYPQSNPSLTRFIMDIRNLSKANYSDSGTGVNTPNARKALSKMGYSTKRLTSKDFNYTSTLTQNLDYKLPFIITGSDNASSAGAERDGRHAWICDAHNTTKTEAHIILIAGGPGMGGYRAGPLEVKTDYDKFHMNLGWGYNTTESPYSPNGWYYLHKTLQYIQDFEYITINPN